MEWCREQCNRFSEKWSVASTRKRMLMYVEIYTILFFVTFLLSYSPFVLLLRTFIWSGDGRTQNYPTMIYTAQYIRYVMKNILHGDLAIPMFDMSIGLGEDIISTLNYYGFGDPFSLLAGFLPVQYIEYYCTFLEIVYVYLAGLAFSALCCRHGKRPDYTLVGALIYAFCGYSIIYAAKYMFFITPMIQLPLLLIGIDKIMQREKPFLFIFSVLYSVLCGFYFLYMMTVMMGVYTLVHFFVRYGRDRFKGFVGAAGRIIGSYALGIGMGAVFFLPAVMGVLSSSRATKYVLENYFFYEWEEYVQFLLLSIAPSTLWIGLSMAAVTILATVFLIFCHRKQYLELKILLIMAMVFYFVPFGGYVMGGFSSQTPRWAFGFALLLSYITVEMLPDLLHMGQKQKKISLAVLLFYFGFCLLAGGGKIHYLIGAALLGFTLFVLRYLNHFYKSRPNEKEQQVFFQITVMGCILIVMFNVSVNTVYKYVGDSASWLGGYAQAGRETYWLETSAEADAKPYADNLEGRFEGTSFLANRGVAYGVPTLYSYWSISNKNVMDFWRKTENICFDRLFVLGADQRPIMNSLLSAKYFMGEDGKQQYLPYGYEFVGVTENGYLLYENQNSLPWGYTYDSYMSYAAMEQMNGLEVEEAMLQSIFMEEDIDNVSMGIPESNIDYLPYTIVDMSGLEWENGILQVKDADAAITLEVKIPAKAEGYLRFQNFIIDDPERYFSVMINWGEINKYAVVSDRRYKCYSGLENYLYNLGYFAEEEKIKCTITFPETGIFQLGEIQVLALPMDCFTQQVEKLAAEPLENIMFETNKITGTVDLSCDKILCMSIPYSAGWSAKVDGIPAEISRGNTMFMALPLQEGHHIIEFVYCSPGMKAGILLSVLSFGIVIVLWVISCRKRSGKIYNSFT